MAAGAVGPKGARKGDFVASSGAGFVRLRLHVRPGAAADRVGSVDPWRAALTVHVKAKPERGEANAAVVRVVALAFHVPPADVHVEKGATSREKIVRVDGISQADARAAVEGSP